MKPERVGPLYLSLIGLTEVCQAPVSYRFLFALATATAGREHISTHIQRSTIHQGGRGAGAEGVILQQRISTLYM